MHDQERPFVGDPVPKQDPFEPGGAFPNSPVDLARRLDALEKRLDALEALVKRPDERATRVELDGRALG